MNESDNLEERGFAIVPRLLDPEECDALAAAVAPAGRSSAGTRNLLAEAWCRALARRLADDARLAGRLPTDAAAVQCAYFEKSRAGNWLVPMHQDLALPVAERVDHPDLRGWSVKEGVPFVQPPDWFLASMVAVRIHLDPCGPDDGPLRVVPGSHRLGRIDPEAIPSVRDSAPEAVCPADRGDALVMKPCCSTPRPDPPAPAAAASSTSSSPPATSRAASAPGTRRDPRSDHPGRVAIRASARRSAEPGAWWKPR